VAASDNSNASALPPRLPLGSLIGSFEDIGIPTVSALVLNGCIATGILLAMGYDEMHAGFRMIVPRSVPLWGTSNPARNTNDQNGG
jgi:hypothetical protein